MRSFKTILPRLALFGMLTVPSYLAQAVTSTITFDEPNIAHGTVVNTQFSGVAISADNLANGPDLAVAYSTVPNNPSNVGLASGQYDADLEGPDWGNNNFAQFGIDASSYNTGNALIIQENNIGCDDGVCDFPDDEGSRPAGTVTFDFDFNITSLSFDLIDFEDVEKTNSNVTFFNEVMESITYTFSSFIGGVHNAVYGDNSINRIILDTIGITDANRVVFDFGGSGAIDTVKYTTSTDIPEPSTLALMILAVLGFVHRGGGGFVPLKEETRPSNWGGFLEPDPGVPVNLPVV